MYYGEVGYNLAHSTWMRESEEMTNGRWTSRDPDNIPPKALRTFNKAHKEAEAAIRDNL